MRLPEICRCYLAIGAGALICVSSPLVLAQSPGLAATPPMGWNSWNHFAEKVTVADVRAATDAMVTSGMKDAGYVYINIDDGWQGTRDASRNSRCIFRNGAVQAYGQLTSPSEDCD
jgi:alpha-galactosidase